MFVYLFKNRISILLLLIQLFTVSLFSQESEEIVEGTEALESNRAITQVRPLFVGGGFDYLFPFSTEIHFQSLDANYKGTVVKSNTSPDSLHKFSIILNPYFIVGMNFPYIFGINIPISVDIYTKLGFNFVDIGYAYSSKNEFLGYKSFDINGNVNIRSIFILNQYINLGAYITSGIGFDYPIFRGYGYFKNTKQFFLSDTDYNNIIDNSDKRLSSPKFFTSISTGFIMDKVIFRNIKFIIGYTIKFFFSDEINDNKQINFNNSAVVTSFGIKDYSIHHGIQLEFVYSLD